MTYSTQKPNRRSDPKRVRPQPLRRQLASGQPGVGRDEAVIRNDVDDRDTHDHLARLLGAGLHRVHNGDDELREAAQREAGHHHGPPISPSRDDQVADHEGRDPDAGEDARVGEGVADVGHGEEIRPVCCIGSNQYCLYLVETAKKGKELVGLTDQEHST